MQDQIDELQTELEAADTEKHSPLMDWIDKFRNYMEIEELNREVVEELIDKIVIHDGKEIDVYFKFKTDDPDSTSEIS